MDFLKNLCFLCLANDQKLVSPCNLSSSIIDIFGYILPEHALQDSETPSLCDNCLSSLQNIYNFRQKCLQSIKTFKEYIQTLKQEDKSPKYPNQEDEISKDIQNVGKVAETNVDEEIRSEKSETDYSDSDTGNDEQMLGKFEMVEIHVKKEIDEDIIMEEDLKISNLFEHDISNSSEIHKIKTDETEGGLIPPNDMIEIDSQSFHSEADSSDGKKPIKTEKKPYKCDVCEKTFKLSNDMKKHLRIHTGERPYTCEICQKSFSDSSNMRKHKLRHTGERPYTCETCHKSFNDSAYLRKHHLIHTGEKPHTCEICHKSFSGLFNMRRHKLIHTGERPYTCEICQKSFSDSAHLRKHNLIHTGEKPYTCEICQKSFRSSSNLKVHQRIHSNETPYTCGICHKSFTNSCDIKRHELIHTGEKPYTCGICQKSFRSVSNFKRHERTHSDDIIV